MILLAAIAPSLQAVLSERSFVLESVRSTRKSCSTDSGFAVSCLA